MGEYFSEIQPNDQDHFADPVQVLWLVRKADLILSDQPSVIEQTFTKKFSASDLRNDKIPVYAYDDDIPEERPIPRNGKLIIFAHSFMP